MRRLGRIRLVVFWFSVVSSFPLATSATSCDDVLRDDALCAARKATAFLLNHVSTEGGYLWRYSPDLQLREGEGVVDTSTVWIQPPGTPSVGEAFVNLYEATGDELFIQAARAAGEALRRGQMRSGGWQAMVEFDPERRKKWAYRIDPPRKKAKDQSSLDDDKTQSALRFTMQLDRALKFQDIAIHEMTLYGLNGLLEKGQMPSGGFPQVWTDERPSDANRPVTKASYPNTWPREYQGHNNYWYRYTLNDNLAPDVIRTLLLAEEIYEDARYRTAALKLADFLLMAQMPEPQPAWAQQYDFSLRPIWARKFEPAAITGGESQGVIETLMYVFSKTGDHKYIETIPKALDYLERSELPDGRLARFYELNTNRPLYFTKEYVLTYDDSDVPTHYSFKTSSRVDKLRAKYRKMLELPPDELEDVFEPRPTATTAGKIRIVVDALDQRGAWLTDENLRYHKKPGPVIDMRTTVENLNLLSQYLADSE